MRPRLATRCVVSGVVAIAAGTACFSPRALEPCAIRGEVGCADADPFAPDADPFAPDADPRTPDADPRAPDGFVPTADGAPFCEEWTTVRGAHFDPCNIAAPVAGPLVLPTGTIHAFDTNACDFFGVVPVGARATSVIDGVCILSVDGLVVPAESGIRATGLLPLMIVSWGDLEIDGSIDVSSSMDGGPGAGSPGARCTPAESGSGSATNASGGGGGGLGGAGGHGGYGDGGARPLRLGGPGIAAPLDVIGGCPGAQGGLNPGPAGLGGGGIQLTARGVLRIQGLVHASGGGGVGADIDGGGGAGGGSGGFIGLAGESVTLGVNAVVAANGGGGGAGCQGNAGADGSAGTPNGNEAPGGPGATCPNGADGGTGGAVGSAAGAGTGGPYSGGGGGGSAGYVLYWSTDFTRAGAAIVSPDPIAR